MVFEGILDAVPDDWLAEGYGEANRRGPGGGAGRASGVLPTPPAMAQSLRLMALVASGEAGRAAVT